MECTVCYNSFDEAEYRPLILGCGHTYCKVCISNFQLGKELFNCPTCNQPCALGDVGSLATNFSILTLTSSTIESAPRDSSITMPCSKHPAKKVKFICTICEVKFCTHCIDFHQDHKVTSLKAAAETLLTSQIQKLSEWQRQLEEGKGNLDTLNKKAQTTLKKVRDTVERRYAKARAKLDNEYQSLGVTLDEISASNQTQADKSIETLETSLFTVRNWLLKGSRIKSFGLSLEEKLQTADDLETETRNFSVELPGLNLVMCKLEKFRGQAIGEIQQSDSSSVAVSPQTSMVWWFKDDQQNFVPCNKDRSDLLDSELKKGTTSLNVGCHMINFPAMTQTHNQTLKLRQLTRMPMPYWGWTNDRGEFAPYTIEQCYFLEQGFALKKSSLNLKIGLASYEINYKAMTQKNKSTGMIRKIRRTSAS